jgi:hypothetical protein
MRLEQRVHLRQKLVHLCVLRREADERGSVAQPLLKVLRALAAGLRMHEVRDRRRPRGRQVFLNLREILLRESNKRFGARTLRFEQLAEYDSLLRGYAQP